MAVTFYNLNSESGLKKLDEYLLTRSYITGHQASKDDITVHAALSAAPSSEYVNVSRWYNHIDALLRISGVSEEGKGVVVEGFAPVAAEAVATPSGADAKAADEDDDDDVDLFGEETEEEKKAAEERAAAVKASGKKKESGKSSVLLDVKPWDDETDMQKLEETVRSVQMEGLTWGASKLVSVGYGIKKLQIMLTVVDDLVSIDSLVEDHLTAEPANEYIQSCDIVAFNKIYSQTNPKRKFPLKMSSSLLSLSRHRITPSFLTYNNNLLHHLSSSSSSSSRFKGVRFIVVTARRDPNLYRKNQFSKQLLKAKESVKEFHTLAPVLSLDDHPLLLQNQAIGMVAAAQANFMRVVVESAGSPAEKPRSFKALLEAKEDEEPRVGVELLCVVKAVLKKIKRRVLVGDKVLVGAIDWVDRRGMIDNVFQRKSEVMNPPVANVDHLLVLFSLDQPKLEAFSVTRFLIEAESTDIPLTLALNKTELVDKETERAWRDRLRGWGYEPLFCSVESKRGFDSLECLLKDQTTVIVGPSGVGKSSLINALRSKQHVSDTEQGINSFEQIEGSKWLEDQRVGEVSTRSGRGKHTTRHVSLLPISGGGYLADTPGFSQPSLMKAAKNSLALMFPEIRKMLSGPEKCAFNDCLHLGEQGCVVTGDWERYPYYLQLLDEIKIREEFQLRTLGTKREGDVRYKIGDNGIKQAEPRLVLKKHRRQSRKSMNQSLLDELEEEQDDGDDDDDDDDNLGDVEEVPLEDNKRVMGLKDQ